MVTRGLRQALADGSDEARPPAGSAEADEPQGGGKPRIRDRTNIGNKDSGAGVMSIAERGPRP